MKKRIALYRSQEAASSITVELQEKSCRDFANKKGWQIKNEYIAADGVSRTLDDPLVEIKKAIEAGEVDVILVYSYFCISGDHMELPLVIKWLLCNDVEIWSVVEGKFFTR